MLSLTKRGVIVRDVSEARGKFSVDQRTFQEVRPGDLVFCLFDVPETPRTVGLSSYWGMITGAYDVFACGDPWVARYLEALYIAIDDSKLLGPLYSGLRNTIPTPRFMGAKAPLPPRDEITAIVRFLDHMNRRFQKYIRAKEKLIVLLDEYKQVLIHQAVTGQIDVRTGEAYPAYKPSSVEWLEDLPEHWQAQRLGNIGRFSKGSGGTKADERKVGTPCIRYGDIYTQHRYFVRSSRACVAPDMAETDYTKIKYGDVLFAASGETIDEIGKSAVNLIDGPACCGGDVIILRPSIEIDPQFLGYAADSPAMVRQKARSGRGFTVMHIYSSALKRLTITVPTLPEQTTIAGFLNLTMASMDKAIDRSRRQINLLRDFRTRLIADVVTGKLDVREAAAELPDTNTIDLEVGKDKIQTESHSHRVEPSIAEEANA